MSLLHDYIEQLSGFDTENPVWSWLLKYGVEFPGRNKPSGYVWRVQKNCFANSWSLARQSDVLTYTEGYVYAGLIPIYHAWCIDKEGRVVDVTLRPDGRNPVTDFTYLGIPIRQTPNLLRWWRDKPWAYVLFDLPRWLEDNSRVGVMDVFDTDFIYRLREEA